MTTYTTLGSVCGSCNHKHKSLRTAQACADRHQQRIERNNGSNAYSDRVVVHFNGDPLTEDEAEYLFENSH